MDASHAQVDPSRAEVEALGGATVLEFGTPWCGWCRGAQSAIGKALAVQPGIRHIKIQDGRGQALGRSYRVKLWPTLVFLKDGQEMGRVVRPNSTADMERLVREISAA